MLNSIKESKVKIEITGLKKRLCFRLINMKKFLDEGGLVELIFNGDGTYMEVRQIHDTKA